MVDLSLRHMKSYLTLLLPYQLHPEKSLHNIGIKDGMANVGDQKNEILKIDKDLFRTELENLLACYIN